MSAAEGVKQEVANVWVSSKRDNQQETSGWLCHIGPLELKRG